MLDDSGQTLDASFSVEESDSLLSIVLESRGGNRNTDYGAALALILRRLGNLGAVLDSVHLERARNETRPAPQRLVEPQGFWFPIDLARVDDFDDLRKRISSAQAALGREAGAGGSGNGTKRIRMALGGLDIDPVRLTRTLAGHVVTASDTPTVFFPGSTYSKTDIYNLLGVPASQQFGKWTTDCYHHEGQNFIFANVGIAGSTGHDYGNRWEGDFFVWYGKIGSKAEHQSIQRMTSGEEPVLLFTRGRDRDSWRYEGRFTVAGIKEGSCPVEIRWRIVSERGAHGVWAVPVADVMDLLHERHPAVDELRESNVRFVLHSGTRNWQYVKNVLNDDHWDIAEPRAGQGHHPGRILVEMARFPGRRRDYIFTGVFRVLSDPVPTWRSDWEHMDVEEVRRFEDLKFRLVARFRPGNRLYDLHVPSYMSSACDFFIEDAAFEVATACLPDGVNEIRRLVDRHFTVGDVFEGKPRGARTSRFEVEGYVRIDGETCLAVRSLTSRTADEYRLELNVIDALLRAELANPGTIWSRGTNVWDTLQDAVDAAGVASPADDTQSDATYVAFAKRLANAIIADSTVDDASNSKSAGGDSGPVFRVVHVESTHVESFASRPPRRSAGQARRVESRLVTDFVAWLRSANRMKKVGRGEYLLPDGSVLRSDVFVPEWNLLIEAKADSRRESIRMAIGQLLDYRRFHEGEVGVGVLVPEKPSDDLLALLDEVGVGVWCRNGDGFASALESRT